MRWTLASSAGNCAGVSLFPKLSRAGAPKKRHGESGRVVRGDCARRGLHGFGEHVASIRVYVRPRQASGL
jgi:hypothetical protein